MTGHGLDVSTKRASRGDRKARSFRLTESLCEAAGWAYELRTEPDRTLAANIGWITAYRLRPPQFDRWMPAILVHCHTPRPIAEIRLLSSSPFLVPVLGHLLWLGWVGCDLTQPLREATMVWTRRIQEVQRV